MMTLTLADVVREHARNRPDAPALTCGEQTLTFAELDRRSSQVAQGLRAAGVQHGDRVAVLDKNSPAFYEVAFGCSKIGAVVVGLNWRLAPPEIATIVRDAELSALFIGPDEQGLVADDLRPPLTVAMGDEYEKWLADKDDTDPQTEVAPEDVVLQLYSSGTTGQPKGAMITSANLSHTVQMAGADWRMGPDSVNLVPSPLFHIGGAGYGLTTLSQGGHTVLMRQAAPTELLTAIQRHGVTHAFLVPAIIQSLLDCPAIDGADLSSLTLVGYGGAPIGEGLLLRALDRLSCQFLGVYGMTETSGTVMVLAPEDHDPGGPRTHLLRSVGRPLPWVEVAVKETTTGEDVQPGTVGELWIRCGQNIRGYWRQPEMTAQALVGDGWLRTGDAAHVDQAGFYFLHDRLKDMIISGGENVYPAEVESVLADHPDVLDVAVIAVPHERWGETVKAVVVTRPGTSPTAEEIIEFSRTRLARYKCPTSVDVVDLLPRNASGKVLKKDLRAPYWVPPVSAP
jgi:acyl-CoA synthetase (AMP-forming)/AMP-acid ligase II